MDKSEIEQKSRIAGLKIDLQYARMKAHQYGTLPMGGTKKLWEAHWMWNSEVRRLETELMALGVTEF